MTEPKRSWVLVVVRVDRDAEELISVRLFELGTRGIVTLSETKEMVELGAYFDASAQIDDIGASLQAAMSLQGALATAVDISIREVEDQDWLQKWKEGFEPTEVGQRFLVAPSWKMEEAKMEEAKRGQVRTAQLAVATDSLSVRDMGESVGIAASGQMDQAYSPSRYVIQIDPGMAFGTGTHETTRLCLEAIEQYWGGGKLLDVGTGTGILAIAAGLMFPESKITGIDVDPQSVEVARENVSINSTDYGAPRPIAPIDIIEGQPERFSAESFDLVVANLTAEVIADLLPHLKACLAAEGRLVLSGILVELAEGLEATLTRTGLRILERRQSGEWAAIVAEF